MRRTTSRSEPAVWPARRRDSHHGSTDSATRDRHERTRSRRSARPRALSYPRSRRQTAADETWKIAGRQRARPPHRRTRDRARSWRNDRRLARSAGRRGLSVRSLEPSSLPRAHAAARRARSSWAVSEKPRATRAPLSVQPLLSRSHDTWTGRRVRLRTAPGASRTAQPGAIAADRERARRLGRLDLERRGRAATVLLDGVVEELGAGEDWTALSKSSGLAKTAPTTSFAIAPAFDSRVTMRGEA